MTTALDLQVIADRYLDGELSASEWQSLVAKHGESLRLAMEHAEKVRDEVRALPRMAMPADLFTKISNAATGASATSTIRPSNWFWRYGSPIGLAAALIIATTLTFHNLEKPRTDHRQRESVSREGVETAGAQVAQKQEQSRATPMQDERRSTPELANSNRFADRDGKKSDFAKESLNRGKLDAAAPGFVSEDKSVSTEGLAEESAQQLRAEADAPKSGELKNGNTSSVAILTAKPAAPASVPQEKRLPASEPAETTSTNRGRIDDADFAELEKAARKLATTKDGAQLQGASGGGAAPGPLGLELAWANAGSDKNGNNKLKGIAKSAPLEAALAAADEVVARTLDVSLQNRTVSDIVIAKDKLSVRALDANGLAVWSLPLNHDRDITVPARQQVRWPISLTGTTLLPASAVTFVLVLEGERSAPLAVPSDR